MKKIIMALGLVMFTMVAFAGVNSKKAIVNKSNKKTAKSKEIECHAYQVKYFHHTTCATFSWYTVDWVDTINVTCDANGQQHVEVWHWNQNPSLVCSH